MADEITKLENARALKKMGVPLNMPVEERTFSIDYSRHWFDLMNAHHRFMVTMDEFVGPSPRAGSIGKWRLVLRRLRALIRQAGRCVDVLDKLPDENERALMNYFLVERADPFIRFWLNAVATVDAGTPLTINPGDIPPWINDA